MTEKVKALLNELGQKQKDYRWHNRLTFEQFAEKSKASTVLLGKLETGKLDNLSLTKLMSIVEAMGLDIKITYKVKK